MVEDNNSKPETVKKTEIPGVFVIERPVFPDDRGFFHEVFRLNEIKEKTGLDLTLVQMNHSVSYPKVIRAIHTENWHKIIYPLTGNMFAAIADVRPDSPTFGKVLEFTFDNSKKDSTYKALLLPPGIGNTICVVGDEPVHYIYAVTDYWSKEKASGIAWDDPDLNIKWPIENPVISERDRQNPTLRQLYPDKFKKK